jgi:hypothetical protein
MQKLVAASLPPLLRCSPSCFPAVLVSQAKWSLGNRATLLLGAAHQCSNTKLAVVLRGGCPFEMLEPGG